MIKFSVINRPGFHASFSKLLEAPLSGRTILSLKRMAKKIEEEMRLFESTRKQICQEAALKNDDGSPIIVDGKFSIPEEILPAVQARIAEAADCEIDLGLKLAFETVETAGLTAKDLLVLEDLIEDPKEE